MTHEPNPTELQTDPELDALLDETLSPEAPPDDLAERIVAETAARLPRPPVLARVGSPLWRAAAAVAIVAGVGLGLWSLSSPNAPIDDGPIVTATPTLEQIEVQLDELDAALAEVDAEPIDQQIELIAVQMDLIQLESAWAGENELIDQAVTSHELDEFVGDAFVLF